MCAICGCSTDDHHHHGDHSHGDHSHDADHAHGAHQHGHGLPHSHDDDTGVIDFGAGPAGLRIGDLSPARTLRIERDILSKNNALAAANRQRLERSAVFALNLMSSPGSGKTSLLVRMIADLRARHAIAVIEGDQQTTRDAERIRAAGAPAVQINTGRGCHLDAHMVGHALDRLPLAAGGLLFIENVGNLVCPSAFDLGEARRVVVLSVTEGEDKPLKYPDMFAAADLMLLNKIDLLPHLDFDVDACVAAARRVNPTMEIALVSARTGAGLGAVYAWFERQIALRAPGPVHG